MRTNLQTYRPMTLYSEIMSIKKPKKETIQKTYGSFGVDIFEGKTPTLLEKKDRTVLMRFINSLKGFFGIGTQKYEYESSDRMSDVMLKYMGNKKKVTTQEITEKFGEKGEETLQRFRRMGYAKEIFP